MGTKFILGQEDGTIAGGSARGEYAVDLQTNRTNANQVAGAEYSNISGGISNRVNAPCSAILGGNNNYIAGSVGSSYQNKIIVGGSDNQISNVATRNTFIGGGYGNNINGSSEGGLIVGGYQNTLSGSQTTIGGGQGNIVSSSHSTISGGQSNTASTNSHATVVGGQSNVSSGQHSVSGGFTNTASGQFNVALGNTNNTAGIGAYALGSSNTVNANGSTENSFAIGESNNMTSSRGVYSFGRANTISGGKYSFIVGQSNTISASLGENTILGFSNTISGTSLKGYAIGSTNTITGGAHNFALGNANQMGSGIGNKALADSTEWLSGDYTTSIGISPNPYLRNQFIHGAVGGSPIRGRTQVSNVIAYNDGVLTTGGTTVLSLDGTGVTNLIIPYGTNRMWNVTIKYVAVVTTITGTATGVTVGDTKSQNIEIGFKKVGGVSSLVGGGSFSIPQEDASMGSASLIPTAGASQELALTFTAPTFAGGGSVTCRVVAKVELVEVAF